MEEPGRLQSIGSQGVGHNWNDLACVHACGQSSWDETLEMRGSKNWATPGKCKLSGMLVGCGIGSYTDPGTKILKERCIAGRWMDEALRRGSHRVWKLQCWLGTSMSVGSSSQVWGAAASTAEWAAPLVPPREEGVLRASCSVCGFLFGWLPRSYLLIPSYSLLVCLAFTV